MHCFHLIPPRAVAFIRMLVLGTALAATLCLPAPAAAQACEPAAGGPPCETASGIASLPDPDGSDLTIGNPIHPITGNKYQEDVDAVPLPGPLGLEVRRHYNTSYVAADGPWGRGWQLSYDTRLHHGDRPGGRIQIVQADGRRRIFQAPDPAALIRIARHGGAADCGSEGFEQGQLMVDDAGYRWVWPQQRELRFDRNGWLVRIAPIGGSDNEAVRIERRPDGLITAVTDPAGRRMTFDYDVDGYLNRIRHPLGDWHYRISPDGRLQSVTAPDGVVRSYRYDDAGHRSRITAIVLTRDGAAPIAVGRWQYDAAGRVVGYRRGDDSLLTLDYDVADDPDASPDPSGADRTVTRLTNGNGVRTRYVATRIAGQWRVTEIRGPGCAECGPTNLRMRYDARGRLVARWTIEGEGVSLARDTFGRIVAVTPMIRPDRRPVAGSSPPESPESWVRFAYADNRSTLPSQVVRPSVVPGGEYRTLIDRDLRGGLLRIVETGQAPGLDAPAERIERETVFRWTRINGRLQVAAIDGPLPDRPGAAGTDADLLRIDVDPSTGLIAAEEGPDGTRHRVVRRDAGGRVVERVTEDRYRRVREDLTLDLQGRPTRIRLTGWLLDPAGGIRPSSEVRLQTTYRYDLAGRRIGMTDPAARDVTWTRDAAGRVVAQSDRRGHRSVLTRDGEGRLRVAALYRPGDDAPLRAAYLERDDAGRPSALLVPDGRLHRYRWTGPGDGLVDVDADGRIRARADAAAVRLGAPALIEIGPDGLVRIPSAAGLSDDFGRRVIQRLPDHGIRRVRQDEAGRIVEATDGAGHTVRFEHDSAGRLLRTTLADATALARYRHEGRWLVGVDDDSGSTRMIRDALGRVTETRTTFSGLPGRQFVVGTDFDPDSGLVRRRRLADGQALIIDYTDPAEGATVRRLRLRSPAWVRIEQWLQARLPARIGDRLDAVLPARTVIDDVRIDPFDGLAGFTHGNGIRTDHRFDRAGRLQAIRIGRPATSLLNQRLGYRTGDRITRIETIGAGVTHFEYDGFGRLRAALDDGRDGADPAPQTVGLPWLPPPAAGGPPDAGTDADTVPQRDAAGRRIRDARFRYVYGVHGQIERVLLAESDHPIAEYRYDHRRQRTAKRLFDTAGTVRDAVFYLWSDGRLAAEIDPQGRIRAQYLGLRDGRRELAVAKLERSGAGEDALHAIHTDHRGAPVAMTDGDRHIVWRARLTPNGRAEVQSIPGETVLNLRLPGQYFDAETGLHDNRHRTYDPATGRYLQPDPLGYPDGPDAYAYGGSDPINRIDPDGLYQLDVHYYMTFFLAATAGHDLQDAWTIALAAQHVDDNPLTRPVNPSNVFTEIGSIRRNQRQLLNYHFVLSGEDGRTLPAYDNARLDPPDSPQLRNLLAAARSPLVSRNGQLVLFGEYLHSVADTYSHRDWFNRPYNALALDCGIGHGHHLHEPDMTYDERLRLPSDPRFEGVRLRWRREARTLRMEIALYERLSAFGAAGGKATPLAEIEATLRRFNATPENERTGFNQKIRILEDALMRMGYGERLFTSEPAPESSNFRYDASQASRSRLQHLRSLDGSPLREEDFPGVCLPGGTSCAPV